ncbi:MAG: hypothetical protein JRJ00_14775 [Deltaproteobacteria bacterium]|nr:hypothetical protein [Deltaproteobacteria bacterium]
MPKIIPNTLLENKWFDQAMSLLGGQELFVPTDNKRDATAWMKKFNRVKLLSTRDFPVEAESVSITMPYRDGRWWIRLKKEAAPFTGYLKDETGHLKKVQLEYDPERSRMLKLMARDGYTIKRAEETLETTLTIPERKLFR